MHISFPYLANEALEDLYNFAPKTADGDVLYRRYLSCELNPLLSDQSAEEYHESVLLSTDNLSDLLGDFPTSSIVDESSVMELIEQPKQIESLRVRENEPVREVPSTGRTRSDSSVISRPLTFRSRNYNISCAMRHHHPILGYADMRHYPIASLRADLNRQREHYRNHDLANMTDSFSNDMRPPINLIGSDRMVISPFHQRRCCSLSPRPSCESPTSSARCSLEGSIESFSPDKQNGTIITYEHLCNKNTDIYRGQISDDLRTNAADYDFSDGSTATASFNALGSSSTVLELLQSPGTSIISGQCNGSDSPSIVNALPSIQVTHGGVSHTLLSSKNDLNENTITTADLDPTFASEQHRRLSVSDSVFPNRSQNGQQLGKFPSGRSCASNTRYERLSPDTRTDWDECSTCYSGQLRPSGNRLQHRAAVKGRVISISIL